jgi:hypothetical protein
MHDRHAGSQRSRRRPPRAPARELDGHRALGTARIASHRDVQRLAAEAEPKDDGAGDTDFVWYVGTDDKTYGAFTIPSEGFRAARWEATEKGPMLMVQASDVLIALFPRADDADE